MQVTMRGNHIECELNGRRWLDVHDETFLEAGRFGLWTKADANTAFDDLAEERLASAGH